MELQAFKIDIAEDVLVDLRQRLARTRWPDAVAGTGWEQGADLTYLKELVEHWRSRFDWRARERSCNELPHFRASLDGFGVHFIHVRGKGPRPMPLIITHGWPGSFLEMLDILPLLTDPGANGGDPEDAFDLVVPSLPGFGFSDRPSSKGMSVLRIARLWVDLMEGLGYSRFGAQGGDFGAGVTTRLGYAWPERLIGIHLNYIPGSYSPYIGPETPPLSAAERNFLESVDRWLQEEGGYSHIQRTRPQTLSYGLNDSPAGLAAWIVEKFRDWGDCEGDVERRFSKDELLANVTLYWVTQTIGSSVRLYWEGARAPLRFGRCERVRVPCGVARFPLESPFPPREWIERCYDVRRFTQLPRGGHFAAMEEPELLAHEIRAFFRPLR
jgi:pimeloyl-ACP methyl ester carboxylesterase